jgi:hypothetical protein
MLLCEYVFMRTTIEIPDDLFRRAKATAALRGSTLKALVVRALEREFAKQEPRPKGRPTTKFPVMPWKGKKKIDLTNFNFDDSLS